MSSIASTAKSGALTTIFITILIDLLGFGMVIPMIVLFGQSLAASPTELAILGGAYSAMQFFFAPVWGALSDRIGRRPVLLGSIAASVFGYLLFATASGIWTLIAARAFSGMCAANISSAQAYVADVTTPERRSAGMALVGAAFGLGFTLGPPLGGILTYFGGLSMPGYFAAGLALINFCLALKFLKESLPAERRTKEKTRSLSPLQPAGFSACRQNPTLATLVLLFFVVTFAFAHFEQTFMLLFKERLALAAEEANLRAGFVLMWIGVIGVIIQGWLIRKLVPRYGELALIRVGLALHAVSFLLFPLGNSFEYYFFPATILAIGSSLLNPSLAGLTSRSVSSTEQGAVLGFSQGLGSLARALGPMSGLSLFAAFYWSPFVLAATVTAGCLLATRVLREASQFSAGQASHPV
jgi:DHA1 family tetracycline resistance protein-like MFS transporter